MSDVKPEICFVRRNSTPYGGAEKYLNRLSGQLSEQGYKHRIINSSLARFIPSFLRVIFFNLAVCFSKGSKFYFSLERISCPDIYRAGDGVHRQYLKNRKNNFKLLNPVYLYLEQRCFNNAQAIIANSEMVKNEIINHYNIDSKKISVIYSGIDLEKSTILAGTVRKELSIDPSTKIILFVGSGFARKGVAEMLQLLAKLDRKYFAIIVGKEKHLSRYIALTKQLGLSDKVKFCGPVKDVEPYYVDSDIFFLPTTYEPFSNVVLEAMRGGNAVITTRQNGAAEILQDEFVMESATDEKILPVLQKILDQPEYLERIKQQNLETVKGFSIEKNTRETVTIIEAVLNDLSTQ